MRLLSFVDPQAGSLRLGIATDSGVIDALAAAGALGLAGIPADIAAVIAGGSAALAALAKLVAAAAAPGDAAWLHREDGLRLGPAVPNPGKIVCVGLNYRQHAAESSMEIPETPVIFSKFANAIAASGDVIPLPRDGDQFDYEAELAIIIGRAARAVDAASALDHVFGYCNANDFSCRDLQFRNGQWLLGKCYDGWCPVGPYLVTADEIPDPDRLTVRCCVNGELRQDGNSSDMIFSCRQLIAYISRYVPLAPGDLILTGTPAGVALGRPDRPWLKPGDELVVAVAGLGQLRNTVGGRQ